MRIVLAGGSGQIGRILARALIRCGHDVVILSRNRSADDARVVVWDGVHCGSWARELEGACAVVNLAGRSVNCRYSARRRREIMESRVATTKVVSEAISHCDQPPPVWLQASTATIYAHRYDAANDEATGILGGDGDGPSSWGFSIDVAKAWEAAVFEHDTPNTRKVLMRSAMVMSPDSGGIFDTLLGLVRYGLGGTCGDGRQYVSWIHEFDFVRAVQWLIEREELCGAINLASPHPLPNRDFMETLRNAWGISFGLPANRWMLEVGAFLLRTETELILKSRRVIPGRLLGDGFSFSIPDWSEAARELCQRRRAERSRRLGS